MPTGRRDLQRPPRALLTPDVREVGNAREHLEVVLGRWRLRRLVLAAEIEHGLAEVPYADGLDAGKSDFRSRLGRADEVRQPRPPCAFCRNEGARDGAQAFVETELTEGGVSIERARRHLIGGSEDGERNRTSANGRCRSKPCV